MGILRRVTMIDAPAARMTRRRKLVLAAVVAVGMVLGGYGWTVASHRLEQGNGAYYPKGSEVRRAGPVTEARIPFIRGGEFSFGITIRNPGPWPVTITDVAIGDHFTVADLTMIVADENTRAFGPSEAVPFKAAKLAKGGEMHVFIKATMPDLETAGTWSMHEQLVTYQVLGQTRQQRAPMGFYLALYPPGHEG